MKQIPNILTVLRLLLVPLFILLFFATSPLFALPLFWLAGVTDVLDGYLARRNNWGSTFGKVLDPVADKLMQGAALLCFALADYLPLLFILPFVAKELAQAVLGFLMLRRREVVVTSHWYGKALVTLFYVAVTLTVLCQLPQVASLALTKPLLYGFWCLALLFAVFTFISYTVSYARLAKSTAQRMS